MNVQEFKNKVQDNDRNFLETLQIIKDDFKIHKLPSLILKHESKLEFDKTLFLQLLEELDDNEEFKADIINLLYKCLIIKDKIINDSVLESIKNMEVVNICHFLQEVNNKHSLNIKNTNVENFSKDLFLLNLKANEENLVDINLSSYKELINDIVDKSIQDKTAKKEVVKTIFRKLTVNRLELGDIVYDYYLQHPCIIIEINGNNVKIVYLSTKPNEIGLDNLLLNTRFLPQDSWIRLNTAINIGERYFNQYLGSIGQEQFNLVLNFLKTNKLL